VGVGECLEEERVDIPGGVAFEPSEDVEVGFGATGSLLDVGLGSLVAVGEPVDGDQVQCSVGLAVASS
jgi:hypothetical protein